MRSKLCLFLLTGVYFGGAGLAEAQTSTMMHPPKVLVIAREVVKPGKGAAHAKWEEGYPRAYAKANWPTPYLAMTALTGESRVLFMAGYDSMADWEKDAAAQDKNAVISAANDALGSKDGDFLTESKEAVFTYQEELSYQPDAPVAGTRGFMVASISVKPGHGKHFEDIRKMIRAAHEKANLSDHYAVYHCVAGASSGLYLIFIPIKSLADADQFPAIHGKAYQDALGEDGQNKITEFSMQGVESSETQLFVFSPKMSYPPKEWVEADHDFWAPKAEAPMKAPAEKKKEAAKP
jgi:hypothetical protein